MTAHQDGKSVAFRTPEEQRAITMASRAALLAHRDPQAVTQIDEARREPSPEETRAEREDPQLQEGVTSSFPNAIDTGETTVNVIMTIAERNAYRALRLAAVDAHAAQEAMASTGVGLRAAIQALCEAIAPAKR